MKNKKIKALFIAPDLFVPENKNGTNKTIFNILKENEYLSVDFLYPSLSSEPIELEQEFSNVNLIPVKVKDMDESSYLRKIKSLLRPSPFIKSSNEIIKKLSSKTSEIVNDYEIIQVCSLAVAPVLDAISKEAQKKTLICAIDCYSFFYEFKIKNEKRYFKKIIWKWELLKGKVFERRYYKKTAKIFFVTNEDARYARVNFPSPSIKKGMIYGVDIEKINKENLMYDDLTEEKNSLIFTGNLSYRPNVDSTDFILDNLMPLLWKIKPEIKVYFVGAGAPERLKNFQDDRVMVTGFVESLMPYMKKAQIFISPIFFGAGTKTKVLEAMGMGKLVVGTKDSFTGILCTDGHDCLVIDPPRDMELWITKIIDVLEGKDEISKLENNARETIEKFHDWNVNKLNYVKEYRELL